MQRSFVNELKALATEEFVNEMASDFNYKYMSTSRNEPKDLINATIVNLDALFQKFSVSYNEETAKKLVLSLFRGKRKNSVEFIHILSGANAADYTKKLLEFLFGKDQHHYSSILKEIFEELGKAPSDKAITHFGFKVFTLNELNYTGTNFSNDYIKDYLNYAAILNHKKIFLEGVNFLEKLLQEKVDELKLNFPKNDKGQYIFPASNDMKPYEGYHLLKKVLLQWSVNNGFNQSGYVKLYGLIPGKIYRKLLQKKYLIDDIGAPEEHLRFVHMIQFLIVAEYNKKHPIFQHTLADFYAHLGNYSENKFLFDWVTSYSVAPEVSGAWDLVTDRIKDTDINQKTKLDKNFYLINRVIYSDNDFRCHENVINALKKCDKPLISTCIQRSQRKISNGIYNFFKKTKSANLEAIKRDQYVVIPNQGKAMINDPDIIRKIDTLYADLSDKNDETIIKNIEQFQSEYNINIVFGIMPKLVNGIEEFFLAHALRLKKNQVVVYLLEIIFNSNKENLQNQILEIIKQIDYSFPSGLKQFLMLKLNNSWIQAAEEYPYTLMAYVIRNDFKKVIEKLVNINHLTPIFSNDEKQLFLLYAVQWDRLEIVRSLLFHGIKPFYKNNVELLFYSVKSYFLTPNSPLIEEKERHLLESSFKNKMLDKTYATLFQLPINTKPNKEDKDAKSNTQDKGDSWQHIKL